VSDNGRPEFGPLDPFLGDPNDPAAALEDEDVEPLGAEEHADVLSDIEDLEVFEALLGPAASRASSSTATTAASRTSSPGT
jgi:hypothetical protein